MLALALGVRDDLLQCGHVIFQHGDSTCIGAYTRGMRTLSHLAERLDVSHPHGLVVLQCHRGTTSNLKRMICDGWTSHFKLDFLNKFKLDQISMLLYLSIIIYLQCIIITCRFPIQSKSYCVISSPSGHQCRPHTWRAGRGSCKETENQLDRWVAGCAWQRAFASNH